MRDRPKARTMAPWQVLRALRSDSALTSYDRLLLEDRPRTRAECVDGPRPCPWVACRHHLYLDVKEDTGAIRLNFPDLAVEDMTETCSLDVADRGALVLAEVGKLTNLTRERARQIVRDAVGDLEEGDDL